MIIVVKLDVVMYTSTITSIFSLNDEFFYKAYGLCSNHGNITVQQMCRIRKLKSNEIMFFILDKIYDSRQICVPCSYKHCRFSYQNCMNLASSKIDKIINNSDIHTTTNEYIYDSFIEDIASYTLEQKLDTEHY